MQPTGMQATGMQATGMQPTGIQATGMQRTYTFGAGSDSLASATMRRPMFDLAHCRTCSWIGANRIVGLALLFQVTDGAAAGCDVCGL